MEDIDAAFFRGLTRETGDSSSSNSSGASADSEKNSQGPPAGGPPSQQQQSPSTGVTLSGLLGAIDGVAAQEGRLLFATTNKYKSLDPALIRPGRLDMHVQFDYAGKWQVEELFRCFFPPVGAGGDGDGEGEEGEEGEEEGEEEEGDEKTLVAESEGVATPSIPSTPIVASPPVDSASDVSGSGPSSPTTALDRENLPLAIVTVDPGAHFHSPALTAAQVNRLARRFAQRVPDREFSMAAIQGLLMQYKTRPYLAVEETGTWVKAERRRKAEREGRAGAGAGAKTEMETEKENAKAKETKGEKREVQSPSWFWAFGAL